MYPPLAFRQRRERAGLSETAPEQVRSYWSDGKAAVKGLWMREEVNQARRAARALKFQSVSGLAES